MVDYCDPYRTEKGSVPLKGLSLLALGGNGISWVGGLRVFSGGIWLMCNEHARYTLKEVDSGSNGPRENAFLFSWPTFRCVILLYQQQNSKDVQS